MGNNKNSLVKTTVFSKSKKILCAGALLLGSTSAFALAATDSPMAIFSQVGIDQAQKNFIPSAIVWILLLTGAMSAMMQKIMPFIIGCVCCLIMALAPDIATSFETFDFISDVTTTTTP